MTGTMVQSTLNVPVAPIFGAQVSHQIIHNISQPDNFGNELSAAQWILAKNWGVGKNVGNAFASGTNASGSRVLLGMDIDMFGGSSGIHQGLHINPFVHGSGDSAVILEGNGGGFSPCMWVDTSGEGCVGLNINGTQQDCIAVGTITSTTGTGDTNPVFSINNVNCNGAAQLINDGIIIDTSITKLHTNLTGAVSAQWETNPLQMGSLTVTAGTAVLSTGICITTADIPQSTTPGTYQTQLFACSVHDGLPLTTGGVFVANGAGPEQCNVLTVPTGSGATVTLVINGSGNVIGATPGAVGSGYTSGALVSITGGGGSGAVVQANVVGGQVTSYTVISGGTGYATTPTGTVLPAGNISCAKFHPTGSYIFQGGTQGFGDFDDDLAQAAFQHTVVYVLGATDTSHLIIAQRQAGAFSGLNLPYEGGEPAGLTLTGGFTIHPGALCVNTNSTNTACTLEFNAVAWRAVPDVAPITSFSITSNVVTILASNNFTAGESATISGMGVATYLNGQSFTVLSAGLSPTQFEIAFTHANVGATADTGTATSPQHGFASPTGIPTLEAMVSLTDSQTSPDSPQSPGDGIDINFRGTTQHGGGHAFIRMLNSAAPSKYANSGKTCAGCNWLTAPPAIDISGPMGNLLQFDMALAGLNGTQVCSGGSGTLLCFKNSRAVAPQFNLFTDAQGSEQIQIDGPSSLFRFKGYGLTAAGISSGDVSSGIFVYNNFSGASYSWLSNEFVNTDGVVTSQFSNRYNTDPFVSFSSCNTGTCTPTSYLSNASLSAGSFAAANLVAGSRPAQIDFAFSYGTGTTNYCYVTTNVTSVGGSVGESGPSPQVCVPNGTVSVNNLIRVQTKEGSQSVNVYRAAAVGSYAAGLICSGISNASFPNCIDSGQAAGALPPTVGNSGFLFVDGAMQANSASVLASSVAGDIVKFDNTTGHLADSGISITSIAPLYSATGTLQASAHMVNGSGTLVGGTLTVTLSGAAVFSNSGSYVCNPDDSTGLNGFKVTYTSGSSVTFTGTGSDAFRYTCVGN